MSESTLEARIERVCEQVAEAAIRAGRDPGDVTIVAVCKTFPREAVDAAYALGMRHFGENRVQEAEAKLAAPPLPGDAVLHLIGQLQSNKARPAAALFDLIESVDRTSLIDALEKEAARLGRPVPVLLQVNVAREPQNSGCAPEEAPPLADRLISSPAFDLRGLMTIAPLVPDPELARPTFAGLRDLRDRLRTAHPGVPLDILSMGMSDDYAVAVAEGATHLRIGRAIFGIR
ncbi:MAG: YggS family pyridoxal phosphate-dependent enzyme [Chloroflexota bacterium]